MRTRAATWLLTLGVLAVSCGPGATESSSSVLEETTSEATTTSAATTTSESTASGADVELYLVEISNQAADVDRQIGDFECSYNEQFFPGSCGVVEDGEEVEPPQEPTEEEQFSYQQGLWVGMFDMRLAHAEVLGAIAPPAGFESAHREFVDSYRAYFTYLRDLVAGFVDLDEFNEFFDAMFDPIAEGPPGHLNSYLPFVESCVALEELGSDAGYRIDLSCPTAPPEPESINVGIGDAWSATPNPLPVGDGLVLMTINNNGSRDVRPVVLHVYEGNPLDLPIIDGVIDLSRDGMVDPASGYTGFNLVYAGEDAVFIDESGVTGQPPVLSAGESVEAVIWSGETMVVFDYEPGQFEAGAYVVVERSGSP